MLDDAENQSYGSRRLAIICVAPWMLLLMEKGRSSCNSGSLTESCVRADGTSTTTTEFHKLKAKDDRVET
ncbi:predicted protein [Sclerotinia sclerotiorum 1980 UF-70]|uniref:Uncharacterized protein n=1 Tax=Sclerotinia sclerotiorum (strain ATCC 18683 / 1980 / Ss-1) TaxID=665079 RepID=A7EKY7_SCLS1|nr:predicted protein [Sclerotinia sclerotiorum 1980 UF-70]EDO03503.1 predicted protein [Sclerotinia sclerotiorum 1980 UF-70]